MYLSNSSLHNFFPTYKFENKFLIQEKYNSLNIFFLKLFIV